ncbi:hypothetical protein L5F43_09850 [Aliarcobacter butzleri]|uniref:hypothetical protein n=1 Tax=Aliarcobacter butzleri TaxID=28197 RepID=UPI001EDC7D91|nr:hypothetical protein [Aliarcobacter butzleri]MCG3688483.1 hypothetical protein [Aliarcobacter butzleri]MCG3706780.1 hypothetical protein [Aliarcobacter butzleri]MCT7557328.1 hypothetical protein [Aliarcobacter butzleri]MCT7557408.1 hypothetical protein [Aliarcobacter butzleri]MCT7592435.1 hypothetical protein [Aliarcobacter butzleri]
MSGLVFKEANKVYVKIEETIERKKTSFKEWLELSIFGVICGLVFLLHFDYVICVNDNVRPFLGYEFLKQMGYIPIFYSIEKEHFFYFIETIFFDIPGETGLWILILSTPFLVLEIYMEEEKDINLIYKSISILCIWGLFTYMFYVMRFS